MHFETKLILGFGAVIAIVLYMGGGSPSFEEASSQATSDELSLDPARLEKLNAFKRKFAAAAIPECIKNTDSAAGNFTIVVEIGSDGEVARSWRRGDSKFVVCIQQSMTENFIYRHIGQPFFTSLEFRSDS
jgi:hypothetical protein